MSDQKIGVVQARLQQATIAFQQLEAELSGIVEARQRLDSQLNENELVLKEFTILKPHNTVYKLVGPSLVPQDQTEAKQNVEKRLDYIRNEVVETQLQEAQEKTGKKRGEVLALQQELQSLQGGGAATRPVPA